MVGWLITIASVLVVLNYLVHRDVLYPALMQAFVWLVIFGLYAFLADRFIALDLRLFGLVVGGMISFSIGAFIATHGHRPRLQRNFPLAGSLCSWRALVVPLVLAAIGLVLTARAAAGFSAEGPFSNPLSNLRFAVSRQTDATEIYGAGQGYGVLAYFLIFAFAIAAIATIKFFDGHTTRGQRVIAASAVLIAAVFAVLSTGRGLAIWLVLVLGSIPLVLRVVRPVVGAALFVGCCLTVFFVGGVVLDKGGSMDLMLTENIKTMYDSIVVYTVGSLPALGTALQVDEPLQFGRHTFRTLFAVLHAVGINVKVAPLVQQFTFVPMPQNLYTMYLPYVRDFGLLGGVVAQLLFGLLHGFVYRKATAPNPSAVSVYVFAFTMVPLMAQYTQDQYFSLLSTWFQYAGYAVLFFLVLREPRSLSSASTDSGHLHRQLEHRATAS